MIEPAGTEVVEVSLGDRSKLEPILEESFEGWYLMHARRVLHEIGTVRAAVSSGVPLGLIMVKDLEPGVGYIFYVAVLKGHRMQGIAGVLLKDALARFMAAGIAEVFASVEGDNLASERLFASQGFLRTSFVDVSRRHGALRAMNMYRMMVVVPGEVLLHKTLA